MLGSFRALDTHTLASPEPGAQSSVSMDGEFSDPDVSAASSLVGKSDGRKHGPSKGSLPVSKLGNGSSAGSFLFDPASWLSMEQSSPLRTVVFGLGFFNNSYDAFVMSIVLVILSHAHDPPLRHLSTVAMATMSGVIAGQLVFGAVGPMIGRTRAFILTQCLVIAGALAAALTNAVCPPTFSLSPHCDAHPRVYRGAPSRPSRGGHRYALAFRFPAQPVLTLPSAALPLYSLFSRDTISRNVIFPLILLLPTPFNPASITSPARSLPPPRTLSPTSLAIAHPV